MENLSNLTTSRTLQELSLSFQIRHFPPSKFPLLLRYVLISLNTIKNTKLVIFTLPPHYTITHLFTYLTNKTEKNLKIDSKSSPVQIRFRFPHVKEISLAMDNSSLYIVNVNWEIFIPTLPKSFNSFWDTYHLFYNCLLYYSF